MYTSLCRDCIDIFEFYLTVYSYNYFEATAQDPQNVGEIWFGPRISRKLQNQLFNGSNENSGIQNSFPDIGLKIFLLLDTFFACWSRPFFSYGPPECRSGFLPIFSEGKECDLWFFAWRTYFKVWTCELYSNS